MHPKSKNTAPTTATTRNPLKVAAKLAARAFSSNANANPPTSEPPHTLAVLTSTESWPSNATLTENYPAEYHAQETLHIEVPTLHRSQETDLDMIDFEDRAWGSPPSSTGTGWISSLFSRKR